MDRHYTPFLETSVEFLKGVGPHKAEALWSELGVKKMKDLLYAIPFRYVDKTTFNLIKDIRRDGEKVLLLGTIVSKEKVKIKGRFRLNAVLKDGSGFLELTWFQGVKWIEKLVIKDEKYLVYGAVKMYGGRRSIIHPEMEKYESLSADQLTKLDPVYPSSELLDKKGLGAKGRRKIVVNLFSKLSQGDIEEDMPEYVLEKLKLCGKYDALKWIHFPPDKAALELARNRLKFEELFFSQLVMLLSKASRKQKSKGIPFKIIGEKFNAFFNEKLPFQLTGAQKRVIKEIRSDLGSGIQMNRLLQGDVGSGKTIVALMCMLIAIDNECQACMLAPTEILAQQHYKSILEMVAGLGVKVAFLSGSIKGKKRKETFELLASGHIDIIIGTHAILEDKVVFKNLGLAVTDEQHRFGVGQRAKLWMKNESFFPHILVMTATPIPRTLAMTQYGDLDYSVIDELPPGRKEIKTVHKKEASRGQVNQFIKNEIAKGRQVYVVYPLIDESEKLDLENLQQGYENLLSIFPRPEYQISVVHGRMKSVDKEWEMERFVKKETQIMVATTVIEVGVNVPNASMMVIENSERFGLSQLHQLRGRVGRGADQSYCILMTSYKLSKDAKERIGTMVRTNDGFQIAEADLLIRGPGDIAGTQQSGIVDFKIANLVEDQKILQAARHFAIKIIDDDPTLDKKMNSRLRKNISNYHKRNKNWGRIS